LREDWEYLRGDVYLADLNPVVGAEIGGIRPVLVLQNNIGNHFGSTLIAAPMTSNIERKPEQPTHFIIPKAHGLERPSMVVLEQLRTLDKSRIIKYMGRIDRRVLESPAFCNCLAVSVAINPEYGKRFYRARKGADK
jgi:mRNA interferase MazF